MSAGRALGLALGVIADGVFSSSKSTVVSRLMQVRHASTPARRVPETLRSVAAVGALTVAGVAVERFSKRTVISHAAATSLCTWALLGATRIAEQGTIMARGLEKNSLNATTEALSTLDTRLVENTSTVTLSRAAIEAVADNTSDVVVAPLIGGAIAGIPGILTSRLLNIARNGHIPGKHSTAVIRILAFIPTHVTALLTLLAAPVVGGSASGAKRAWRRDTVAHPNPAQGRVQAAFAGALEIRLGGRTTYPYQVMELPVLGEGRNPDAGHVTRAIELSKVVGWLAAVTAILLAFRPRRVARSASRVAPSGSRVARSRRRVAPSER